MKGDKLIKLSGRFEAASKRRAYLNNDTFIHSCLKTNESKAYCYAGKLNNYIQ